MHECVSHLPPWNHLDSPRSIFEQVQCGKRPSVEIVHIEGWCELMQECWHQDPKQRPVMQQVLHRLREIKARHDGNAEPSMLTGVRSHNVKYRRTMDISRETHVRQRTVSNLLRHTANQTFSYSNDSSNDTTSSWVQLQMPLMQHEEGVERAIKGQQQCGTIENDDLSQYAPSNSIGGAMGEGP